MKFLHSEYQFKAATQKIEQFLAAVPRTQAIRSADLVEILRSHDSPETDMDFLVGASRLAATLNMMDHRTLKRGQILQEMSQAFARCTWQSLREDFHKPVDFRRLFPDAILPYGWRDSGEKQLHPFPPVLARIPKLAPWREIWEECAVSTEERPFFPPMLPRECFSGFKDEYELRRDWCRYSQSSHRSSSHHFENGASCVLVRHKQRHLIGAGSWRWWGNCGRISGVGFSLYLLTDSGWLKVFFDIRPSCAEPTYGPRIYSDLSGDSRFIRLCLDELVGLSVHRYADDDIE